MNLRLPMVMAMILAACTARPPHAQQPASAPGIPQPLALSQRCTNPRDGYSISYPGGWFTNDGSVIAPCSVFDPNPIDLPRNSEIPFELAVVVDVEDIRFDTNIRSSEWERVLSAERLTIAGRNAYRVEAEATGEGLADRGQKSLRYALDLGRGKSLFASTYDTGTSDQRDRDVLDRMVQTLTLP